MSMRILIVYHEVPENTKFYDVEVEEADWEWMSKTHNQIIGVSMMQDSDEETVCDKLAAWLEDRLETEVSSETPIVADGFDYVLYTGILI